MDALKQILYIHSDKQVSQGKAKRLFRSARSLGLTLSETRELFEVMEYADYWNVRLSK